MHDRRFKPTEAHKLEDPERLIWLPPSEVLAHLELRPGLTVADIGAGTGYFAIPIAKAIAPDGKVFAVDVEPQMLDMVRQKLFIAEAPRNIELVQGESTQTNLPDGCADRVLMANVWHEFDDHGAVLREMQRVLRPGGHIAILDWRPDVDHPPGPPLDHRITPEQAIAALTSHHWSVEESCHVGRYSYLVRAMFG